MVKVGDEQQARGEDSQPLASEPLGEERVTLPGHARLRRYLRRLGLTLGGIGALLVVWVIVVYFFGDPVTALYQDWQQHRMTGQLDDTFKHFKPPLPLTGANDEPSPTAIRAAVLGFSRQVGSGQPIGRIEIPRLHLNKIFVNGTGTGDLMKGPGRYTVPQSYFPGMGRVTAIAGHRTTFGAPFRHIDHIKTGDRIQLLMPYGTFTYQVFGHRVVRSDDWSILHKRSFETLVLSACHPLYSASHRWVVFARLVTIAAPARVK